MSASSSPSQSSQPVKIQSLSREASAPYSAPVAVPQAAPSAAVAAPLPIVLPTTPGPELPATTYVAGPTPGFFSQYWRKVGGGSLIASLLIHAGLLIGAVFIVQTIVVEPKVDFLPGGGSKAGADASQAHTAQVMQKKRSSIQKTTPMRRVVTNSATSTMSLPDLPMDTIDMPEVSSMLGGAMSSGGFGGGGFGGGSGAGFGSGNVKGFLSRTVFGNIGGGDGLPGSFYDMKQDSDRKPLAYNRSFNTYAESINKVADKKFSESSLKGYYKAKQEVTFTYLLVPANTPASEGPKCFNADKEVEPSGWFVHYSGTVTAPEAGEYRFVGFFDDLLIVYINNKPVLDGSWVPMCDIGGNRKYDDELRQEFHGPKLSGNRTAYYGKWIKMNGHFKMDIMVGETPGGLVGGLLMIEKKGETYEKRPDGTPILPIFTTTKLDVPDLKRLTEDPFAKKVQFAESTPIFTVSQSKFDDRNSRTGSSLLPRRQ